MPSAVDTVTFQNKKPKAILTGSATQAESTPGNSSSDKTGTTLPSGKIQGEFMNNGPGTNEASVAVTTPVNSLVVVTASMSSVNDSTPADIHNIRILDGAATLNTVSTSIPSNTDTLLTVQFVGVPNAGSRTYNVQTWSPGGGLLMYVTINVTHVQLTDTHAATGKNINIIDG